MELTDLCTDRSTILSQKQRQRRKGRRLVESQQKTLCLPCYFQRKARPKPKDREKERQRQKKRRQALCLHQEKERKRVDKKGSSSPSLHSSPDALCSLTLSVWVFARPASPVGEFAERPLDVHPVAHPAHAQVQEVLFSQRRQVRAINLVVQEAFPVFSQVQVHQPICNVVLAPVGEGLSGKGPGRWGQSEGRVIATGRGGDTRQEVSGRKRSRGQEGVGHRCYGRGEEGWWGAGEEWVSYGHGVSRWGERGLELKWGVVHGVGEEGQGGGPGGP